MARSIVDQTLGLVRLSRTLGLRAWQAKGLVAALIDVAAMRTPDGGIGALTDAEIARAMDYDGDAGQLIEELVQSGFLARQDCPRLVVVAWRQVCPDHLKRRLRRAAGRLEGNTDQDGRTCPPMSARVRPRSDNADHRRTRTSMVATDRPRSEPNGHVRSVPPHTPPPSSTTTSSSEGVQGEPRSDVSDHVRPRADTGDNEVVRLLLNAGCDRATAEGAQASGLDPDLAEFVARECNRQKPEQPHAWIASMIAKDPRDIGGWESHQARVSRERFGTLQGLWKQAAGQLDEEEREWIAGVLKRAWPDAETARVPRAAIRAMSKGTSVQRLRAVAKVAERGEPTRSIP